MRLSLLDSATCPVMSDLCFLLNVRPFPNYALPGFLTSTSSINTGVDISSIGSKSSSSSMFF